MKYPNKVENFVFEKSLKDVQFPLAIKLCLIQSDIDNEIYENFGYKDQVSFYMGKSKFAKHLIGWNGHTKNGTTIAPVQGGKE